VSATLGVAGFYVPRIPHPSLMPDGSPGALSIYDARQLKCTLEQLVDFKLINRRAVRLSVGAVDVRTGNSTYFDNRRRRIGPEHVMASGALPPAFAPVEIDGEHYWDGGIVSNTPLWYVIDESPRLRALIVQVDLFSAGGEVPGNLSQVMERHKDIVYSSKTRFNTKVLREIRGQRAALARLLQKLPRNLKSNPDVKRLEATCTGMQIDIVHFMNRRRNYTSHTKDYEFSRATVNELWAAGLDDVRRAVAHPEWLKRTKVMDGIQVYDLARGAARDNPRDAA
jgi:NTE family protein